MNLKLDKLNLNTEDKNLLLICACLSTFFLIIGVVIGAYYQLDYSDKRLYEVSQMDNNLITVTDHTFKVTNMNMTALYYDNYATIYNVSIIPESDIQKE